MWSRRWPMRATPWTPRRPKLRWPGGTTSSARTLPFCCGSAACAQSRAGPNVSAPAGGGSPGQRPARREQVQPGMCVVIETKCGGQDPGRVRSEVAKWHLVVVAEESCQDPDRLGADVRVVRQGLRRGQVAAGSDEGILGALETMWTAAKVTAPGSRCAPSRSRRPARRWSRPVAGSSVSGVSRKRPGPVRLSGHISASSLAFWACHRQPHPGPRRRDVR